MAESAPYQYLDATGVIVPDTSSLLADVQSEYQAVFGADLIVTPDTPQGVLITAETLARTEVVNNNAALANQINPNIAGGVFLDAILALTGMQRTPASPTVVTNVTL
ncbi:baseplate J/gp47 family protein, partial [Singulisphaera rosea]